MTQMQAVFFSETGTPDVLQLGEFPRPVPQAGEVLVEVAAVSVNPIDTYIRSGAVAAELPPRAIPGCDLAGTVVAVGEAVTEFQIGDRVWGSNQGLAGRQGTFAEFCSVAEQWLYPVPEEVDFELAAAGALTGITAHLGLFLHAGLRSGEVVFVNGGSGGVGSAVVQLAKAAGATVITTAGSAEKASLCLAAGADHVIQYRSEDVSSRLAEITARTGLIHVWFETLRNPSPAQSIPLLAKRGRLVLMAGRDARPEFPVGPFYVKDLRLIGFAMFNASAEEQRQTAAELNRLLATGAWKPGIGARFPFSQAAAAHRLQEENTLHNAGTLTGKIILTPQSR